MSDEKSFRKHWPYFVGRVVLRVFLRMWERFEVHGAEYVPAEGPCIIASNHVSFLDPPAIGCAIPHRVVHFLARDTLFRGVVRKWFFTKVGCVPIDRTRGDVGALRRSLAVLKEGRVLALFPEGTRSPDGQLRPAKRGIGFLVSKAEVPVVPAYVDGSFYALPKGARRIRRGRMRVFLGRAITPEEINAIGKSSRPYEEISALIMTRIAQLKDAAASR